MPGMIRRILLGLGGTHGMRAKVACAMDLAERLGAEVTAATVFDPDRAADVGPVPVGAGRSAADLRAWRAGEIRARLEAAVGEFKTACDRSSVRGRVIRETGDEFAQFIDLWRYHDLSILGLRGLFEDAILPSPADSVERLIARGLRPILAVGPGHRAIESVVIAYNGSIESAKAMKSFAQMSLWPVARVRVACFERAHEEAAGLLHAARDYLAAHGVAAEVDAPAGSARDRLAAYAREVGADLVVMGATNRRRLSRVILGDTALEMIRRAEASLFLTQ